MSLPPGVSAVGPPACYRLREPDCGGHRYGHHYDSGDRHQGVGQLQLRRCDYQGHNRWCLSDCRRMVSLQASRPSPRRTGIRLSASRWPRQLWMGRDSDGAASIFFAYIGFDAVSTAAQEAKNPKRDMPIGILGSLVVCTILYILVSLVLTGLVQLQDAERVGAPVALGIDATGVSWGSLLVKVGAVFGLATVMLVMLLGQTRVFYSMSKDGLACPSGLRPFIPNSAHPGSQPSSSVRSQRSCRHSSTSTTLRNW
jgi:hypothetical protein